MTITRTALLRIASLVRPALAAQEYIPALTHIRFDGDYALAFNDIAAISVRADMPALKACVPGELLVRALGSFSGDALAVQTGKGGELLLLSGRSKVKLPTLPLSAFPFELPGDIEPEVVLGKGILAGIERCLVSVGKNSKHPAQMGITMEADGSGHAVLYSTDDHSISVAFTKDKVSLPGGAPVLLPTFLCEQIVSLAKAFPDEKVILVVMADGLLADFGQSGSVFSKTVIDLEPIDFPRIVSKHCNIDRLKTAALTVPDALDASLARCSMVLASEQVKTAKMSVKDSVLSVSAASALGTSEDDMAISQGPDHVAGFLVDPDLVVRGLKRCSRMAFGDRVLVLRDEAGEFVHLIAHVVGPAAE